MTNKLPDGIRPGTKEWGAAASAISRAKRAARIRQRAGIPPDAEPIADVAAALGISRATLRTRISKGNLTPHFVGSRLYVRPAEVVQPIPISKAKREAGQRNIAKASACLKARRQATQAKVKTE